MTPKQLVKEVWPSATDKECHDLLWNTTAFPCTDDWRYLKRQLREAKRGGGGVVKQAIAWACRQMEKEHDKYLESQKAGGERKEST